MAIGDTPTGTSLQSAADKIVSLFDADLNIAPDATTPDNDEQDDQLATETPEGDEDEERSQPDEQDEDTEDPDHTEAEPQSKRKLKLPDGAEVDEDEAVKGYLRQSDYTRKTQQVAEERKKLEGELRPQVERYAKQLAELEAALKEMAPQEPNWKALRQTLPPEEFSARVAEWQLFERQQAAVKVEREKAEQEAAKLAAREHEENAKAAFDRLMTLIPEWKDDKVGKAERQQILEYVAPLGLTREHLAATTSPELFVILRDAARYHALKQKTGKSAPAPQKKAAAPVLRPGAAQPATATVVSEQKKARDRAKASGRVEDAAARIRFLGVADI